MKCLAIDSALTLARNESNQDEMSSYGEIKSNFKEIQGG